MEVPTDPRRLARRAPGLGLRNPPPALDSLLDRPFNGAVGKIDRREFSNRFS